jgi:hypothetical protein
MGIAANIIWGRFDIQIAAPGISPKPLKRRQKSMTDKDKSTNAPCENVVEHPQLRRDRAFALFLARSHARNHGKPPPDPASIHPAVFTRLTPEMSREQKVENLITAFERMGVTVKRDVETKLEETDLDKQ